MLSDTHVSIEAQPQAKGETYAQLQNRLLLTTMVLTVIGAIGVAFAYSLNIAANYALGAVVGIVYLRLLARSVGRFGPGAKLSSGLFSPRLALFVGLFFLATRLEALQVIPIFLGFMTYKMALLVYGLQILLPSRKS